VTFFDRFVYQSVQIIWRIAVSAAPLFRWRSVKIPSASYQSCQTVDRLQALSCSSGKWIITGSQVNGVTKLVSMEDTVIFIPSTTGGEL
jgi:hypothetical protein